MIRFGQTARITGAETDFCQFGGHRLACCRLDSPIEVIRISYFWTLEHSSSHDKNPERGRYSI